MTLDELIAEAQKLVTDLQAYQAGLTTTVPDPVVSVETTTEAGTTETFVPETEPVIEPTA